MLLLFQQASQYLLRQDTGVTLSPKQKIPSCGSRPGCHPPQAARVATVLHLINSEWHHRRPSWALRMSASKTRCLADYKPFIWGVVVRDWWIPAGALEFEPRSPCNWIVYSAVLNPWNNFQVAEGALPHRSSDMSYPAPVVKYPSRIQTVK